MRRADSAQPELWALLDVVKDPEIPVISIWELGVLQDIEQREGSVIVTITPTYSGCPAMSVIAEDVVSALGEGGYPNSEIVTRLSPAWSTSWIVEEAQEALRNYGIAPPGQACDEVSCPQCGSQNVRRVSEFGSTACKALYQCGDCAEPFDRFKPI
ncbi:MAG: phenylacetate-CoA oxygenase subunit PaaJ [Proteobacteria bacterium]|nr:phenylacetate-CoA oxygenase subunit PaaJ [Pseudomonadota bacterium]